jgi:hypothetical protein
MLVVDRVVLPALDQILLFLGNLVTGTNTSSLLILIPGAVASLLATPAWNLWLGLRLLQ